MPEQAVFTLGQAAKAVGKSKATISNAIKNGRLSVQDRTEGGYQIAASELFRVFPVNGSDKPKNEQTLTLELNSPNRVLERELEVLREERERERRQAEDQIADLRQRLDQSEAERRATAQQLTALLTDRTEKVEAAPVPEERRGWFRRLFA